MKYLLIILILIASPAQAELLDAVIRVPQGLDTTDPTWQELNPGTAFELYRTDAEFATYSSSTGGNIAPGTTPDNPYKLIVASLDVDGDSPAEMLDALFMAYGLDWTLLGLKTFFPAKAVYDNTDPDNPVLITPIQDTYYRQPLEADIFPYLKDRPTWDCSTEPCTQTGVQAKNCNWLPAWGNSQYLHWQCL